jgi:hypothetical protein
MIDCATAEPEERASAATRASWRTSLGTVAPSKVADLGICAVRTRGQRTSAPKLLGRVMSDQLQVTSPDLRHEIVTEAVVRVFVIELEAGPLVDASG